MTLMGIKWCLERSRRGYQLDVGNDNKLDRQRRGRKSSLYIHTCQNDSGKGWGTDQGRSRVKEGLRLDPRVAGTSSAFVGIRHDRIINPGSTIAGDRRRGSMSSNATPKRRRCSTEIGPAPPPDGPVNTFEMLPKPISRMPCLALSASGLCTSY